MTTTPSSLSSTESAALPSESIDRRSISAGRLQVTVLPQLGAKIASIRLAPASTLASSDSGEELLQTPLTPYRLRRPEDDFAGSDGSGFDECLPTVAPCTVEVNGSQAALPDHGEFWKLPWSVQQHDATSMTLAATGHVLPLQFTKTVRVGPSSIALKYSLANSSPVALPWAWSAHPLFSVEAGDRIVLPPDVSAFSIEGSSGNRLGSHGGSCSWPIASTRDGAQIDLSIAAPITAGTGDKLFTGPVTHGWCGLYRARLRLGIVIRFDPAEIPFLGLWLCYGGWPDRPGPKQYAVAIEPCTAPVDSLATAIASGHGRHLSVDQSAGWQLDIQFAGLNGGIDLHDFVEWCGKVE